MSNILCWQFIQIFIKDILFTITRLYLTLGVDTHPRLFLDEISNNEIANKIDTGEWEEYLKNLITIDVEKEFNIVNRSYPAD